LTQSDADKVTRLPRGPHALPRDVVIAHQRERLLDAAVADDGYADLTVRDLIDRAGVSRRTFYQLFDDKTECIVAAHERAFERLSGEIVGACRGQQAWADRVAAAIAAALAFAVESPCEAHLVVIACHSASDPKLASPGHAAHEKLADLLRAGRKQAAAEHAPPELTEQAVVGAAMAVVGGRLLEGDISGLPQLAPELIQIILTPYLGGDEALRVAQTASA
jgi:AcrR family transcriptional regulator